jgi:DNA polymerase-3 subunit epsilon
MFTAIDVETANADKASICQIGIARFEGGAVAHEWKTYIDPEDDFYGWDKHGIGPETVAGAPTFREVSGYLNQYLNGRIVVSHTAFDRNAISLAASKWQVEPPDCSWVDSREVARSAWIADSYKLPRLCNRIGYKLTKHHDALEDAKAAGQIILAAMEEVGAPDLEEWLLPASHIPRPEWSPVIPVSRPYREKITRDGNPSGRFYGQVLVFSGKLKIPDREAAARAAAEGWKVASSVTKKTTVLVVGDNPGRTKREKAEELIEKGQRILIYEANGRGACEQS